jgi:hypothetical protein
MRVHSSMEQLVHVTWPARYALRSTSNPALFWSDEFGWVDQYWDTFSLEETETLDASHISGRWVALTEKGEPE